MTQICLVFQIHQPYRLRNFNFFEIGGQYSYFDEARNAKMIRQVAENSYVPTNRLLQELMKTHGEAIKISLAISGTALDQMEDYGPDILESFQNLVATGNVELLGQTYAASLSAIKSKAEFKDEVIAHKKRIYELFRQRPKTFFNTALIYSDEIGKYIAELGFKAIFAEGTPSILHGQSPNFLYKSAASPSLKLLLRNPSLSDDIGFRFGQQDWSEWPLTSEKYMDWLRALPTQDELINIVMDYGTFGEHHKKETGIFDFLSHLLKMLAQDKRFTLDKPQGGLKSRQKRPQLEVTEPISWFAPNKDLFPYINNDLQTEALERLYALEADIKKTRDKALLTDWSYLKSADHFLYMDEKNGFSPYENPYDGFLKYMNVLSDLELKVQQRKKNKSISKRTIDDKRKKSIQNT